MIRRVAATLAAGLLVVAGATAIAADNLYVRASGTELKEKTGPAAPTIQKLDIGTKCEVVAKEGNWVKVKAKIGKDVKEGYVFAPKLSKEKPDKERIDGKVSVAAAEGDTAMALRGLSPTSEKFAERTAVKKEDIAAVKAMEQRKVTPQELDAFLKEGKLGEYVQ